MPWTKETIHPSYKDTFLIIRAHLAGGVRDAFQGLHGGSEAEAVLTPHLVKQLEAGIDDAARLALKRLIGIQAQWRKNMWGKHCRASRART